MLILLINLFTKENDCLCHLNCNVSLYFSWFTHINCQNGIHQYAYYYDIIMPPHNHKNTMEMTSINLSIVNFQV